MLFVISKILGFMLDPFKLMTVAFLLGSALFLFKKSFAAIISIFIGVVLFFLCGFNPLPHYCISPLEKRIIAATIPDDINGIIVLTGMTNTRCSRAGLIELNSSADRIINGVILSHKYPRATVVICGGMGSLLQNNHLKEADYLKKLSIELGVPEQRIVVERASRTTHEHTEKLATMIPREGAWILVTSAYHMPRALGCFKKAGFHVLPYPVDYQNKLDQYASWFSPDTFSPSPDNIKKITLALHEWAGLAAYRLLGYTDSLFPKF